MSGPGNHSGSFDQLNPGQTKVATVDYPVHSPGVTYRLAFTVDPDNIWKESDETNNRSREFVVTTSR